MYLGFKEAVPTLPRDSFILFMLIPNTDDPMSEEGAEASAKRCSEKFCCDLSMNS